MGTHDNDASRVYRYRIKNQPTPKLTEADRYALSLWFGLLMIRVPTGRANVRDAVKNETAVMEMYQSILKEDRLTILSLIRSKSPELYQQIVSELGPKLGDDFIMNRAAYRLENKLDRIPLDADETFHRHLNTAPLETFAKLLMSFQWEWWRSNHGFIIGDNPVVRWDSLTRRWNCGLSRNIEVLFPFSTHLCLRLIRTRSSSRMKTRLCSREQTRIFNQRQRCAALTHIYAASEKLVRQNIAARIP